MSNHHSPSKKAQFKFSKERFQYRTIHKQEMKIEEEDDPSAHLNQVQTKEARFQQARAENAAHDLMRLLHQKVKDPLYPGN